MKLKRVYGLTETEYFALLISQGRRCAVCKGELTDEALIDHDHSTGMIRGLLCRPCNFGVGLFGDSPDRLRDAADYLEAHALMVKSA